MGDLRFGRTALVALGLLVGLPTGSAVAMSAPPLALSAKTPQVILDVAQEGRPYFHHGKRVQSVYCLRKNYWWFYRPYTTAPEDWPRCEPYFHYPPSRYAPADAGVGRYFK